MRDLAVLYCLLLYDNTVFLRIYDRYKQQNFNGDIRICVKGHKSEINLTSCPLVDQNMTMTVPRPNALDVYSTTFRQTKFYRVALECDYRTFNWNMFERN
jgi:hypothetical protein